MSSNTVACRRCGALNAADFERCIRCNLPLDGAEPADKAARRVPAPRTRGRAPAMLGPGAEPFLGRWEADELPATKLLVAINFAVFALQVAFAMATEPSLDVLWRGGSRTSLFLRFGAMSLGLVHSGRIDPWMIEEPWRLLSACFVHFGVLHIGMNMFGLINLARLAEPAIGSVRFLIVYTATGIIGFAANVAWFFVSPHQTLTAGASGAVFGIVGMVLGFLWRRRDERWKAWLMQAVVYSLVFTFAIPNINHAAHLGGLVSGAVLGALFAVGAPKPSRRWQRWLAYACIVASLGSLVATQASPYVRLIERQQQQQQQG